MGLIFTLLAGPLSAAQSPASLRASYTTEVSSALSSPHRTGLVYNGLLSILLDSQISPHPSQDPVNLHLHAFYPHGTSGTISLTRDFNTFSNIDFYDSPRIYELWLESGLFLSDLSLRVGVLALDSEFGIGGTDLSNLFLNSTFGADASVSLNFPAPIYAVGALGARIEWEPAHHWAVRAAVYDGNPAAGIFPDPSPNAAQSNELNRHGIDFALRRDEGALLALELSHTLPSTSAVPREAAQTRSQKEPPSGGWRAGFLYHTDQFADAYERTLSPGANKFSSHSPRSHSGLPLVYFAIDHELWTTPGTDHRGLRGFSRFCWCPEDRSLINFSLNAGILFMGLFPQRPQDVLGAAYAYTHLSTPVATALRTHPPDSGLAPRSESVLELTYLAPVSDKWEIQPNLQIIFDPGATNQADCAVVLSLRSILRF